MFPPEDALRLLHELQVHQIELEMQNEELHGSQMDLETSMAQYFDLYDLAPVGYFTVSEMGLILEANLTAATLLGETRVALIQQPFQLLIFSADRDTYYEHRQELLQAGAAPAYELQMLKKDGTPFWVHFAATVVRAKGAPVFRIAISDITKRKHAEEAHQQAERFARGVLDGLSAHIAVVNEQGVIVAVNQAWLNFAARNGLKAEKAGVGVNYLQACETHASRFADEGLAFATFLRRVLSGSTPSFELEYACHGPAEQRWFVVRVTPFPGHDCKLAVVAHENVTTRKLAEQQLRASEERFKVLFETSRDALMILEPPAWKFTVGNLAALDLFKAKTQTEFIVCEPWELSPERQPDGRLSATKAKEMILTAMREGACDFEWTHRRFDGTEFPASVMLSKMAYGGKEVLQATVRDITERKQAEAEIQRSKAELTAIYDHTPIVMCLLDEDRRVVRVNRMGLQLANREAHEAVGTRSGELLGCIHSLADPRGCGYGPQCEDCRLRQIVQDTISTGSEHVGEEAELHLGQGRGQHHSVIVHTARLEIEGQTRVLLCVEDITDRKNLEEQFRQAQKMDAVGQLAGGVAHDFNNIIASTMMHLGLLRTNPNLDIEIRNDLKELEVQSQRAATLTRQLLAFGRRSVMVVRAQDLNEIVTNLLKMLRRLIGEDIEVQFEAKRGLPHVTVDAGMMEQVLVNLAVNARDAMSDGGTITLTLHTVEVTTADLAAKPNRRPGQFVCLTVTDTGCGMDEATLQRIFEPFFTTKAVGKGTGLGLATVYGIVAQHQGWINVESQIGHGTTFRIFIPATQTASLELEAAPTAPPIVGGPETLLVVEDEQHLRRIASQRLRQLGYRVLEAANGHDALAQWEAHGQQVDLLLTDMVMPGGLNGLDLAEQLQKTKPDLKVIITSGYSTSLNQSSMTIRPGIVFLPKPYDSVDLAKTVRTCLDGKQGVHLTGLE